MTATSETAPAAVPAPRRRFRIGLPAVRQHSEMDCGAACLSTIAAYYGKRVSINRMRDLARVGREGATMANVARAARAIGFDTQAIEAPLDHLARQRLPAIVNWKGFHWIVVYRVDKAKVVVADPAKGLIRIPRADFEKDFTGYCLILSPNDAFADLATDGSPLLSVLPYFAPLKRPILEVLTASLAGQLIAVSMPLFTKFIIDDVIMQGNDGWLTIALTAFTGMALMQIFLAWMRQELAFAVGVKADLAIVSDVYRRLIRLPISFFNARKSGDVTSRLEEQQTITSFLTEHAAEMLVNLMAVLLYVAIMAWFSIGLTILAVSFAAVYVAIVRFISPRLRTAYGEAFEKGAERQSHIIETLRGIETVKATGAGTFVRWKFDDLYAAFANTEVRIMGFAVGASTLVGFTTHLAGIAVLFAGANIVLGGTMSIGVLIAFTMFAAALFEPMNELVGMWDELQETMNAIERLNDILDKQPEVFPFDDKANLIRMPRPRGAIRLQRVAFRYNPDDPANVLQNIALDIAAGETLAFVGRSGCGKSTILKLIFGFHMPSDGRILIDGFDTQDLWLPSLRRHIGCVPQKAMIFAGSVRDNIALARPNAPLREVVEAARLADAAAFIEEMPGGYEALLSEQGANLSGGQRQRIALARAFLHNPAILMLDEATSALDTATEARVMQHINQRFAGRTILMVAHRLSTVRKADRIVVMNCGLIAEEGDHDTLMAAGGLYTRLHANEAAGA